MGLGRLTTQDLKRCRFNAMAVALIYDWWSLFVRLANPKTRLEAIASRPFLLSGVARKNTPGRTTTFRDQLSPCAPRASDARACQPEASGMGNINCGAIKPTAVGQRVGEFLMTTLTGVNWLRPPPNRLVGAG